jgi:hypothetical protein
MTKAAIVVAALALSAASEQGRRVRFSDLAPAIRTFLGDAGTTVAQFDGYLTRIEEDTARRVAEGDRDHLIYYALQSGRFTQQPRIEPALSARAFVEGLAPADRARLLDEPTFLPAGRLPAVERARLVDLLAALRKPSRDARLMYFRDVAKSAPADAFYPDYVRVARFLYLKEFVAGADAHAVARLYQTRAHSVDTQIDAGFAVFVGLGVVRAIDPAFRATRVLIVGPGLDLAPRTDLIDDADLQSYQPLAVADALLSRSMTSERELRVHSVDVNPRVVDAVQRLQAKGLTWRVFANAIGTPRAPLAPDYADYVQRLGKAVGDEIPAPRDLTRNRHYERSIAVRPELAKMFTAVQLNIVTERLADERFDVIVITNVLPYLDDRALALALVNLSAMLGPGGYLLHNESRATLPPLAKALGLPLLQMRTVTLAGPVGRPAYDAIWIHQSSVIRRQSSAGQSLASGQRDRNNLRLTFATRYFARPAGQLTTTVYGSERSFSTGAMKRNRPSRLTS